ncbi:hypothetical protein CYMTET_19556, partial [Cymbomonas tetramitiformis]
GVRSGRKGAHQLEQPLVLASAALFTAPMAVWQYFSPDAADGWHAVGQYGKELDGHYCGVWCWGLLAVAAMVSNLWMDAAPGMVLPQLHAPHSSLRGFVPAAVVLCVLDRILGHATGTGAIMKSAALMAAACALLTDSHPFQSTFILPNSKPRSHLGAVLPKPLLHQLEGCLKLVHEMVKHIRSAQKQRRLFTFLCINSFFMARPLAPPPPAKPVLTL